MKTKGFIIAAVVLIAAGLIVFCVAGAQCHWDLSNLSTGSYETTVHTLSDNFLHFAFDTNTADIRFVPSMGINCRVECYEDARARHTVSIQGDTLVIQTADERAWYEYIGFYWDSPVITVYLPKAQYGALSISASTGDISIPKEFSFESIDVNISTGDIYCSASASGRIYGKTSTGEIRMENSSAQSIELSTTTGMMLLTNVYCTEELSLNITTGDTKITNTRCTYFSSTGDTGNLLMQDVTAHSMNIERDSGDITFDLCDSPNISMQTDTGDVEGRFLSEKIFDVESDTGHIDIPPSRLGGGNCKIRTDTGDIKITIYHPIYNP